MPFQLMSQHQLFEFVHGRLGFVDAERKEDGTVVKEKSKSDTVCPLIYDKKGSKAEMANYQEHKLSKTGAFILRFVLQKVDRYLIAQLYSSEYGVPLDNAATAVGDFITDLINRNILKPSTRQVDTGVVPKITGTKKFTGIYGLDFSVDTNQIWKYKVNYPT